MARRTPMQHFARWHIWLGWFVGLPILMWTLTGLFMVLRPIEEVRGTDLRIEQKVVPLPPGALAAVSTRRPIRSLTIAMEGGVPLTRAEFIDGSVARFDRNGTELPPLDEAAARALVARELKQGKAVEGVTLFQADQVPFNFRREMPVWQVRLSDGTHVYVGQESGRIEAVRTRWWRWFDFMWGLHILDPMGREDTSHPLLIGTAALSMLGALLGCVLLFRRRRAQRR